MQSGLLLVTLAGGVLWGCLGIGLGGCVIPPSLSVENQDAGVNSPPAILALRSDLEELPEPGPVVVVRGAAAGSLNATLLDTDLDDTLYVRVFVDYTASDPTPARATCTAPPTTPPAPQRSVTCDLRALCVQGDLGQIQFMSVAVFDREPLESGTPAFQAMPPGGLTTSKSYLLQCEDTPQ